ncbi:MAG: bifunctional metallophosphatase/5'-nucleotidase [Syntrophothermus sp.]
MLFKRFSKLAVLLLAATLVLGLSLAAVPLANTPALAASQAHITIMQTSDLHGNIYPIDYFKDKPSNVGLAKINTLVQKIRQENPNSLLIDTGDTIQGTPLVYYHNKMDNAPVDPMMAVMNYMKYDSMTVGNHEFNFGLPVLNKAKKEAQFPWLAANIYTTDGKNAFVPYIVKKVAGVKIGILGLTTQAIPTWEQPANYAGLVFKDLIEEGKKWVPVLRNKEKVDVVVITAHSGFEKDPDTGKELGGQTPLENQIYGLATTVPGIDVILIGHAHSKIPQKTVNGVLITEPERWGSVLGRIDLTLEKPGLFSPWKLVEKKSTLIPVDDTVAADPKILEMGKPYHEAAQNWMNSVIGEATGDFIGAEAQIKDTAIMDLVQKVQMEAGKADLSIAAMFNPSAAIPKGPVTVRQLFSVYIYDNTLYVIEVTGQQLKDALEHSAKFYNTYTPEAGFSINKDIRGYNYDMVQGINYEIDVTQPVGSRIKNMTYKGQPVEMNQKFKLALNNYRVTGGGGYLMFKNAPVIYKSSDEIRNLMIDYVKEHKVLSPDVDNNWRIVPETVTPTLTVK